MAQPAGVQSNARIAGVLFLVAIAAAAITGGGLIEGILAADDPLASSAGYLGMRIADATLYFLGALIPLVSLSMGQGANVPGADATAALLALRPMRMELAVPVFLALGGMVMYFATVWRVFFRALSPYGGGRGTDEVDRKHLDMEHGRADPIRHAAIVERSCAGAVVDFPRLHPARKHEDDMTTFTDDHALRRQPYADETRAPLWGLPDPDMQGEFYADVPVKRAVAWVLDTVLVSLLTGLVVIFTVGIGIFFIPVIFLILGFMYRVITIARKSATWGMRLAAIEFRTHRGERFSTGTAFVHTLAYYASMSFVFPQIISIILMMTSARAQGLTDMVLGTAAVNRGSGS